MQDKKMIEIGICERPHGIKGGFTFKLHSPEDSFLENGMKIFLRPRDSKSSINKDGEYFEIKSIAFGNKVICYLKDITDRNQTEEMLPFSILMSRDEFPELDDGEIYVSDLIGMMVTDHKSGDEIGKILNFYENGAQVVFVIDDHGKKIELPFIDEFFPVVDTEEGIIEINLPVVVNS